MKEYTYTKDKLTSSGGSSVMMDWERPIMKKVAELITESKGDVLNIGFGLGIVDGYINTLNPKSHTIIECHPDVINHINETGWKSKANIIEGKWQDSIGKMGSFDSIYMDTWGDLRVPHINDLIENHLNVGGIFSIWHSDLEFKMVLDNLPNNYKVSYVYLENNNLIPKIQHDNSGYYIDPSLEKITIPIIKKTKVMRK